MPIYWWKDLSIDFVTGLFIFNTGKNNYYNSILVIANQQKYNRLKVSKGYNQYSLACKNYSKYYKIALLKYQKNYQWHNLMW